MTRKQSAIGRIGTITRRLIGTREHFLWLERIVRVTLVLNVLDAIATLYWVLNGHAREANPLMAPLIAAHPVLFVTVKCTLVTLGSYLLWQHRKRPLAVVGIFLAFLAYYYLLLFHLRALELRILGL